MNQALKVSAILGGITLTTFMARSRINNSEMEQTKRKRQSFVASLKQIPHPKKAYKGGEDAYVLLDTMCAVADGVGGWNDVGVDPALFSRELCGHVIDVFAETRPSLNLRKILVQAVERTKAKGSSTFVMVALDPDTQGVLQTLNLGDSGYLIARAKDNKPELVFRSPDQIYGFDFPYQCGTNCELPYEAECRMHLVKNHDLVVVASDGIFDNLYEKDILDCLGVEQRAYSQSEIDGMTSCIADRAQRVSVDQSYDSPFSKHARDYQKSEPGGKVDDITVIVAQVKFE